MLRRSASLAAMPVDTRQRRAGRQRSVKTASATMCRTGPGRWRVRWRSAPAGRDDTAAANGAIACTRVRQHLVRASPGPPANASGRLIRLTMPGAPRGGITIPDRQADQAERHAAERHARRPAPARLVGAEVARRRGSRRSAASSSDDHQAEQRARHAPWRSGSAARRHRRRRLSSSQPERALAGDADAEAEHRRAYDAERSRSRAIRYSASLQAARPAAAEAEAEQQVEHHREAERRHGVLPAGAAVFEELVPGLERDRCAATDGAGDARTAAGRRSVVTDVELSPQATDAPAVSRVGQGDERVFEPGAAHLEIADAGIRASSARAVCLGVGGRSAARRRRRASRETTPGSAAERRLRAASSGSVTCRPAACALISAGPCRRRRCARG